MNNNNEYLQNAMYRLEQIYPQHSMRLFLAKLSKHNSVKYSLLAFATFLALSLTFILSEATFLLLSILYLSVQLFKLYIVINGAIATDKVSKELPLTEELPIYSILLPVYQEGEVLTQLVSAIKQLDYPLNLLDVKLLIEEDDKETLDAAKKLKLPEYVEVIKVPAAHPRTKPKACNYGLQLASGQYIVIYDAEDIPKSLQLKQVVEAFKNAEKDVVCIQAKLNFYNHNENILTKLFAMEYGLLFNYFLPGLESLNLPIPLGGTSNHFDREKLIELGGWDAFNVTEDADLGIRIYQQGYRTKVIDSLTLEEAPITYKAWIKQRTRWIKGNLLTSIMHLFNADNLSIRAILALLFTLLLPNLAYLLLLAYMLLSIIIEDYVCKIFYYIDISLGMVLPIFYAYLVEFKNRWISKKEIILASPIYYFLLSIAAINSVIEIFKKPFHWNKTKHGISKFH